MTCLPKIGKKQYIVLLFFLFQACKTEHDRIPYVPINRSYLIAVDLAGVGIGCSKTFDDEGFKGIIIFKDVENYRVFDRACTNYPNDTCRVNISNCAIKAICPCCKSEFMLVAGASGVGDVIKGPARYPLREYNCIVDGQWLRVSN